MTLATLTAGLISASTSFVAGLLFCVWVMRLGVVDAPDGMRKTQSAPVPRLGGVAILLGALIGSAVLSLLVQPPMRSFISETLASPLNSGRELVLALAFTLIAFCVGLWDDVRGLGTPLKLCMLASVGGVAASLGLIPEALSSPFGQVTVWPILVLGSAAWLLVFTNATNFMDGANGLAIGSVAIMLIGLAATGWILGDWDSATAWFPLFGAIIAFLVHNLRGTLYAGDAGALGLGGLFASFALISGLNVWTVATLALPFLVDVLLTLVWRAKHGRNWLQAHLDHAYQRLIASGWSHGETAFLYWGLSATAATLALIAALAGGAAPFIVFWTLTLAGSMIWIRHRRPPHEGDLSG
ncbi:MAG: hypothetical protein AAGL90_00300 [Pseudomonadota bacterium]